MSIIDRIKQHYAKAVSKHPRFADSFANGNTLDASPSELDAFRRLLEKENEQGDVLAWDILCCELWEIVDAYAAGRRADAIDECYDAIAVLIRMAMMIEKEGGENAHHG